jgi:hypothetical protein
VSLPRAGEMDILLTGEDAERIRGVLAACSKLLAWAGRTVTGNSRACCTTLP